MNSLVRAVAALASASIVGLAAERPALLPKPQQVVWGTGTLDLRGLSIVFGTVPSAEDRFAAEELSEILTRSAGLKVPVAGRAEPGPGKVLVISREGADAVLPGTEERTGRSSRESYRLNLTPEGGELRSPSSAGLFYGVQTIGQLLTPGSSDAALPAVQIEDWPSLAYRGLMMDTAHGALITEQEIKRQIDFLARLKFNQYYFYAETNIELTGYPLLSQDARYTQQEIRRIIAYARERHIDVVPCMELYGHLHDLFKLESYADLGVVPHGGEINPRNPRLQALVTDWLQQLTALFPSPWFHAGLDEPWELERAGSAASGGIPPGKLYIDHLKFVAEVLTRLGKRPMYWADVSSGAHIYQKYPDLVSQLPAATVAVSWQYDPLRDFGPSINPLIERKLPFLVATGIWHWQDVVPDFERTFDNIDGFVTQGRAGGALGVVHTAWTDDAQSIYRMALPGMAYAAAAGWQADKVDRSSFFVDYSRQMFPAGVAGHVASALDAMTKSQALFITALGSQTMFRMWDDPLAGRRLSRLHEHRQQIREARLMAETAESHLILALAAGDTTKTLSSLLLGARMLGYLGMRALYVIEMDDFFKQLGKNPKASDAHFYIGTEISSRNHSRLSDLMDEITTLRQQYRSAWLTENTSWRLGSALGRWDAEYEYWRRMQARFWEFLADFHDDDPLPPLASFRPDR